MRIAVDESFKREVLRFDLRYTCTDCVHFRPQPGDCANEWPNQDHLRPPETFPGDVLFCKEFEVE